MHWNTRIAKFFEDHNLAAIARRLGLSKNRLYAIVHEGNCPNAVDAVLICRYLGVTVEEVFGDEDSLSRHRSVTHSIEAPTGHDTPARQPRQRQHTSRSPRFLAYKIAAGAFKGIDSLELIGPTQIVKELNVPGPEASSYIPILAPIAAGGVRRAEYWGFRPALAESFVAFAINTPRTFALPIDGDSMEPDFHHRDLVVVSASRALPLPMRRERHPRLAIVIFKSQRTATFKLVSRIDKRARPSDPVYRLEPINQLYPRLELPAAEIAEILPVMGLIQEKSPD